LGVLTEIELRDRVKREGHIDAITVDPNTLITPAAAQYARNKVSRLFMETQTKVFPKNSSKVKKNRSISLILIIKTLFRNSSSHQVKRDARFTSGSYYQGSSDCQGGRDDETSCDLEQLLAYTRQLLRNELTGEEIPELKLFGLSEEEIHEYSHHPFKKIGVNHLIPSHHMGQIIAELNYLRTVVRQVELAACDVYMNNDGTVEREDIIRLSTA